VAGALSKSRSHVTNLLRLLSLPDEVQQMVRDGVLSAGHARALITAPDPVRLARRVAEQELSVRETEKLVRGGEPSGRDRGEGASARSERDADTRALEADLSAHLGMQIRIDHRGEGGVLSISYRSLDELDRLCAVLSASGGVAAG
jgi:ParB family chromosome partitioning protein